MHLSCFVTLEKRWPRKKRERERMGGWNVERKCRAGYFKISLKLHKFYLFIYRSLEFRVQKDFFV